MEGMSLVSFGISEGTDALYMAMVKATHEGKIRERLKKADVIVVEIFGSINMEDCNVAVSEIMDMCREDVDLRFACIPGTGFEEEQAAIAIVDLSEGTSLR